ESSLGIGSYKDEFGMPSTNKDWTPEPLLKQLVLELTGSRQQAEALKVTQYANMEEWKAAGGQANPKIGGTDQAVGTGTTNLQQKMAVVQATQVVSQAGPVTPELWADSAVLHRDSILYINAPKLLNDLK
ncbi:MAG: hypothetical protein ABUL46_04185, partial [Chitinophaga rupis]